MSCNTIHLPNNARSLLYDDLLRTFDDVKESVLIYDAIKGNHFKQSFLNSKAVDRNGEPKLLYVIDTNGNNVTVSPTKPNKKDVGTSKPIFVYSDKIIDNNTVVNSKDIITIDDVLTISEDKAIVYEVADNQNVLDGEVFNKEVTNRVHRVNIKGQRLTDSKIEFTESNGHFTYLIDFSNYRMDTKLNNRRGSMLNDIIKATLNDTGNIDLYNRLVEKILKSDNTFVKSFIDNYDIIHKELAIDELISMLIATTSILQYVKTNNTAFAKNQELLDLLKEVLPIVSVFNNKVDTIMQEKGIINNKEFIQLVTMFSGHTDVLTAKQMLSHEKSLIKDKIKQRWYDSLLDHINKQRHILKTTILEFESNKSDIELELNEVNKHKLSTARSKYIQQLKRKLKELETIIASYNDNHNGEYLLKAIVTTNKANIDNVTLIENFIEQLKLNYLGKDISSLTVDEQQIFTYKVNAVRLLIENYTPIEDIEALYSNDFLDNVTSITRQQINANIEELKEIKRRVDKVLPTYKLLEEQVRQARIDSMNLPAHVMGDVRDGFGRISAREILGNMRDINYYMYKLDSMMDSDNIISASVKKHYTMMLNNTKLELDEELKVLDLKLKDFIGSNYKDRNTRIAAFSRIVKDGELILPYTQEYKSKLKEHFKQMQLTKDIHGEESAEYDTTVIRYKAFVSDNFEQEYIKEYYDIYNSLPLNVKLFMKQNANKLKNVVNTVKERNNGEYDPAFLTIEEAQSIADIREERSEYLKTKEGKALKEYYDKINKTKYNIVDEKFFDAQRTINIDTKEAQDIWYQNNSTPTDKYWKELNGIIKTLGTNKLNKIVKKLAEQLFINEGLRKDNNGNYNVFDLSDSALDDLKVITGFLQLRNGKNLISATVPIADITVDDLRNVLARTNELRYKDGDLTRAPNYIRRALKRLDKLSKTVPTSYYYNNSNLIKDKSKYKVRGELLYGLTTSMPRDTNFKNGYITAKPHYIAESRVRPELRNPKFDKNLSVSEQPKLDKYKNNNYDKLSETDREFVNWLSNKLNTLVSHYKRTIINEGFIPAKNNNEKEALRDEELLYEILNDVTGERKFKIPFKYVNKLNQIPYITYSDKLLHEIDEEYADRIRIEVTKAYDYDFNKNNNIFKEIAKHNETIEAENKQAHIDAVDNDLFTVLPEFFKSAITHKAKSKLEAELRLTLATLRNAKYKQETSYGKKLVNKIKSKTGLTTNTQNNDDITSNKEALAYKRMQKDLEMIFYEQFLEPNKYNDLLKALRNYSSLLGIGFNPFSAVKNVMYGGIMSLMEANAGYHFDKKDARLAGKQYSSALPSFVNDAKRDDGRVTHKVNGFIQSFDILEAQLENEINAKYQVSAVGRALKSVGNSFNNFAYFAQSKGEHLMQNSALLAMLNSHRIINGKIQSFVEYSENYVAPINQDDIKDNSENAKKLVIEYNEKIEKLRDEFKNYPTVYDAYELKDGYLTLKDGIKLNDNEHSLFRIKAEGVNHKMHGIYNQADKGSIENTMTGQLLMQFRHWARPGWVKRFGTRGGIKTESFWNIRRNEMDEGDYKIMLNFIANPLKKENIDRQLNGKDKNVLNSAAAILKGYKEFFAYAKLNYNTLTYQQKGSVKRVLTELLALGSSLALLALLKGLGDDDELKDSYFYNFALYELDALNSELIAYNPVLGGWTNEATKMFRTPAAVWGLAQKGLQLVEELTVYPFSTPKERVYQQGIYKGNNKALIKAMMIAAPFNQLLRFYHIPEQNKYMTFR